ncbi:MAG: hypothetical protein H7840_16705 [Alphaproteobacteria bacterium]
MSEDTVRLSVSEAALHLGVSVDTIRRRIKGREIDAQRDNAGKWWVVVPASGEVPHHQPATIPHPSAPQSGPQSGGELLEHLLIENDRLWDALRGKDDVIRELVGKLGAAAQASAEADRRQAERDEAREQLRQLKLLVAQMLRRMEGDPDLSEDIDQIRDSLIA